MPQVAQYIRSLLDTQTRISLLDVVTDGRTVIDQVRELQPDMLIVDALLQGKINGLRVATDLREAGVDLPIICLTVPNRPISIGEGMGRTRVLSMPFSGFDFMRLLNELHAEQRASAPENQSKVHVFYGPKGGTGTTTLAYNVAASIAQGGRYRVALLDGSLQKGDIRALLRVPDNAPSIVQLPISKLQKSDLVEVMYRDRSGVEVLLAPPRMELAETITPKELELLLALMRRLYNIVIVDTSSSVDDRLLAFLDHSDSLIQVLTYEATALYQARAMAETLDAIGYGRDRVRYLVNRADSLGGLPRDAISQQIGRAPDFSVVSDGILAVEANNRGEPLVRLGPDAQITQDVQRVADALSQMNQEVAVAARVH
jgi:pilus assembly protein CpaE